MMRAVAVLCNNIADGFTWLQANRDIQQLRMKYRIVHGADNIDYHVINDISHVIGMEFESYIETPGFMHPRLLEETKARCRE